MTTHERGRNGHCIDCIKVENYAAEHSICWACGHDIDHATGHDCPMWDA